MCCKKFIFFVISLLLLSVSASQAFAQAIVQSLTPNAWLTLGAESKPLGLGARLDKGRRLSTDESGSLDIRFADGSIATLGSSTSVELKDFAFGETEPPRFHLDISAGTAQLETGAVVRQNPQGFEVSMPLARAGIRGAAGPRDALVKFVATKALARVIAQDMGRGQVVTITGLDGRSVDITQAGQQVSILRGQPTPLNAQVVGPAGPAASVQSLTPGAFASLAGDSQSLAIGAPLSQSHQLSTDLSGRLNIRFADGSDMLLGPSTSMEIKDFAFADDELPNFHVGIAAGAARITTGAIVTQNPEGFKISTPLAAVSIRGTTMDIIVTNDKVSIIVRDMSPAHWVTVTGLDGNSVDITQAGQQVDILRGQPTPVDSQPASANDPAVLPTPGENEEEGSEGNANLPHRDVGEQQLAMVNQEMDAMTAAPPPAPVFVPPAPAPVPRTTYPAFMLGLPVTPAYQVVGMDMSQDGGTVVTATASILPGSSGFELWRSDGSHTVLHTLATGTSPVIAISGDGNFAARNGLNLAGGDMPTVYNLNTLQAYVLPHPEGPPTNMRAPFALNGDGSIAVGYFVSTLFPGPTAIARWEYNSGTNAYDAVPVTDGVNLMRGLALAVNDSGTIMAGYEMPTHMPAFWQAVGSGIYTQTALATPGTGELMAITPDGAWLTGNAINGANPQALLAASSSGTFQFLPIPASYDTSFGLALAADKSIVVGRAFDSTGVIVPPTAFFWRDATGTSYDINAHLTIHGVNMGAVHLLEAHAVSADGSIVACLGDDGGTTGAYLVRLDGDFMGLSTPSNVYSSLAGIAAGSSQLMAQNQISTAMPGLNSVAVGNVPAAGDGQPGSSLRVWGTGAFMSNYEMNKDDSGAVGGVGATYFMDNGLSLGGAAYYGYRSLYSLWDSKQSLDSISLGLHAGYAPSVTGIRLALGAMWQDYDLDTRRNYPNGADMASSTGAGHGWGYGFVGHAGWVFELCENVTLQPFAEYTWQWTKTPDYDERGGPFPAHYDSQTFSQNITRLGADLQWDITPTFNVQAWLAWNHRFEDKGPASSGGIIGWQPFYFTGTDLKQDWGDTGLGFRWRFLPNTTLGFRLGFGIDNQDSGLPDMMSSMTLSVDI